MNLEEIIGWLKKRRFDFSLDADNEGRVWFTVGFAGRFLHRQSQEDMPGLMKLIDERFYIGS